MIKSKPFADHQPLIVDFCQREETEEYAGIFAEYGTGKTWCVLDLIEKRKFRKILVVATNLAIDTTWCDEIRKHSDFRFCILRGTAKQRVNLLEYAMGQINDPNRFGHYDVAKRPMLFLINYDGVKSIYYELMQAGFDAMVLDECFVKGTLVDTPDGQRCIEDIKVGDKIHNIMGEDEVISISNIDLDSVVKVSFDGKEVWCSENHLFFTTRGWVKACELHRGDFLYGVVYGEQIVRMVWEGIFSKNNRKRSDYSNTDKESEVLWEILFGKMENETARYKKESIYSRDSEKNKYWEKDFFQIGNRKSETSNRACTPDQFREEFNRRNKRKNIYKIAGNRAQTNSTRGKWETVAKSTANVIYEVRKRMGVRVCNTDGKERRRLSNLLQDRYSVSDTEDCNRSRRVQSFKCGSESTGYEKRASVEGFRVESVEVYKSGSVEFDRLSNGKDTITFYDLQIKSHPSYSVNGVIVHNSTKVKTFDSERTKAVYEVGSLVSFRAIMTGFPVTEHLAELYSQIKFLDRGKTFGLSYYAFLNRYFVRIGMKMVVKKKSIKQITDLIKPFCIVVPNNNKRPSVYKKISLELTEEQDRLLTSLNETFRLELGQVKIDTKYIFTLIAKSLQICDGFIQHIEYEKVEDSLTGKIVRTNKILSKDLEIVDTNKDEALLEVLDSINVEKNKVVIWCGFLFSVEKITRILTKLGIPVLTLIGGNTDDNKTVQWFQKSRDHNVLVCTQKKAAESVTLTASKYAIYYSNIWSNDARQNSEARINRKGSEIHSHITYIDLVTKCVAEETVYKCLRVTKKDLIDLLKQEFLVMKRA